MSDLQHGFVLQCVDCGVEHVVGPAREFEEEGTKARRAAYFAPDAVRGARALGISSGTGDTYRCLLCHSLMWVWETRQ